MYVPRDCTPTNPEGRRARRAEVLHSEALGGGLDLCCRRPRLARAAVRAGSGIGVIYTGSAPKRATNRAAGPPCKRSPRDWLASTLQMSLPTTSNPSSLGGDSPLVFATRLKAARLVAALADTASIKASRASSAAPVHAVTISDAA